MTRSFRGSKGVVTLAINRFLASTLVFLVAAMLSSCTVITERVANPRASTPPGRVLLNATFDDGRLDRAIWNTCHWWADRGCTIATNYELEWYVPGQVSVADGALRLTADRKPIQGSDGRTYEFRSGMVTTGPPPMQEDAPAKLAFTYGSVEARLRVPAGRGLWPAVWLLPASQESVPEIDMLEVLGHNPSEVLMHLHPKDRRAEPPGKEYRVKGPNLAEDWHTIRLDWSANRLDFFVDDVRAWQVKGRHVPDEPMYVVLNLAVGGDYPGAPDADTQFPATFLIDYVRITAA
jgi:beta-glucanase (GH16 family)